ncbi:MAG TPA: XrtA system polysaccharide deacetylase [Candidatus Acidoferrales bacterium]|nr:XrtA system polysaccharide deacetylase [Candidatus Acidoferrales bacterium]
MGPLTSPDATKCVFSIDVEDWFHILDLPTTPYVNEWDGLPSRVERNFLRLLETLEKHDVHVTCFFLGWVAERFPHLVKEAVRQGHEIASHGYEHQLVYQMSPEAFVQDAMRSKAILEDISGRAVWGYRSAGFSVIPGTEWFFDKLIEAGYIYDSSVFPARRGHGGMTSIDRSPHWIERPSGRLFEFPVTVTEILGKPICFFGGGYLRFFPYWMIRTMTERVLRESRPVVFYVHPREIDLEHPRLAMSWRRRFKSYVNLKSTQPKMEQLLTEFQVTSFENLICEGKAVVPNREDIVLGLGRMAAARMLHPHAELTPVTAERV